MSELAAGELAATPRRNFARVSFSRQFLLYGAALLLAGMFVVGNWIARQIEDSAVRRTAAIAGVYVESMLAAQLRGWNGSDALDPAVHATLDAVFVNGPLRRKVLRFKLWDRQGRIVYSSDHAQIGQSFPVDGALAAALGGSVQSRVSDLDDADNLREQMRWPQLLEVYVPLRLTPGDRIVGVAEFYHSTENLGRDIYTAQRKSWLLVGLSSLLLYVLLHGLVRRANDTIRDQQRDLEQQLGQLRETLHENERMRERLRAAAAQTTALNEQFLQRVAADIHDGPAQTIALARMRFDDLADSCRACRPSPGGPGQDLAVVGEALHATLRDLRNIASGLVIPGIAELAIGEIVHRAIREFERLSGGSVELRLGESFPAAPLALKITLYRVLREALNNAWKHGGPAAPAVEVAAADGCIVAVVADQGRGFDPQQATASGRFGLAFMRERVRLLGGSFELEAAPGQGTRIVVRLPLSSEEPALA